MTAVYVWLILAIVALIIEILSPTFGFAFVSVAAFLSAGAAWAGVGLAGQLLCFAAMSVSSVVLLRPLLLRRFVAGPGVPSRTERLVGQRGRVTEAIDPAQGTGRILIGGEDWAAKSMDAVPAGTEVVVDGADGIILSVTPID